MLPTNQKHMALVVLIAAVAGGGYYYYYIHKKVEKVEEKVRRMRANTQRQIFAKNQALRKNNVLRKALNRTKQSCGQRMPIAGL